MTNNGGAGWPIAYTTGPRDHMHALGVVSVNFNTFENALFALFRHHLTRLGVNIEAARQIYSGLQDEQKQLSLRALFAAHEQDAEVREHLEHLLRYFNKCVHNRNYLLHSQHTGEASEEFLALRKSIRGDWSNYYAFRIPITQLRRIADDMNSGTNYLFSIWAYIGLRDGTLVNVDLVSGRRWREKDLPLLPTKPSLPKTLDLPKRSRPPPKSRSHPDRPSGG